MIHILLVDDHGDFCHTIAECLENDLPSVQVICASNIVEARQRAAAEEIDIVLADYRLGVDGNGLELLEELHATYAELDSVLFTGLQEPEVGMRAYEIGAFRYLAKPFTPDELLWNVRLLINKRVTHYERNWLEKLNRVIGGIQHAANVDEAATILVRGGIQLGFERARLYVIEEESEPMLVGHTEAGATSRFDFRALKRPLMQAHYARHVYDQAQLTFFDGQNIAPSVLTEQQGIAGYPAAVGTWVSIPLMHKGRCTAILSLDNAQQAKVLRDAERKLLYHFAQQASTAWEHVLNHEREQRVHRIARRIIQSAQTESLQHSVPPYLEPCYQIGTPLNADALLDTLYAELSQIVPTDNFVLAMKYNHAEPHLSGWLHYWLHLKDGEPLLDQWRSPVDSGLIRYFVENETEPQYHPCGTLNVRKDKAIRPPLRRVALSWMGIPLQIGGETFGAVILEEYQQTNKWSQSQFDLAVAIVQQLSHFLQTAWVSEQRARMIQQLGLLQSASDRIMTLARQQPDHLPVDEWLWHVTLTMSTAHYGFGFDRAMLFLLDEGGTRLRGRMGIGHRTWADAAIDWLRDSEEGMDFERYLALLKTGELVPTPLDGLVKETTISVDDCPTFRRVAEEGIVVTVPARDAPHQLSPAFIERFGSTSYSLIPARAGATTIGVVVLDAIWEQDPPQTSALGYLDTLTNQAALVSENLRKQRVQKQLIELNHQVLAHAGHAPLKETLEKIATAAQMVTGADSVSIYPFAPSGVKRSLQTEHITWIDIRGGKPPEQGTEISSYMQSVLDAGRSVLVTDVHQNHLLNTDFAQDPVVRAEKIRAFIAVPIFGQLTGTKRGLLYLNYRWAQKFDEDAIEQAESFANLVSIALRNWRETHGLRVEKENREAQLNLVTDIQQRALDHNTQEKELIEMLISKATTLLNLPDITVTCILRDWDRARRSHEEPFEIRKYYGFASDSESVKNPTTGRPGLTGKAMLDCETINVSDVTVLPWSNQYEARNPQTRAELDVPIMRSDGVVLGVINVESPHVGAFTRKHESMLERLSVMTVGALDSVQRRQRMQSLFQAVKAISGPMNVQTTLNEIMKVIRKEVPELTTLTLWHKKEPGSTELELGMHFGVRNTQALIEEAPQREGIVRRVMEGSDILWAKRVKEQPLLRQSSMIEREALVSTAAFPLHAYGEPVGALFFSYRHEHRFTEVEKSFFPILAEFIAIAINDALILEEARREREKAEAERRIAEAERRRHRGSVAIAEAVGGNLELQHTVDQILNEVIQLFEDCWTCLVIADEDQDTLSFLSSVPKYYPITNQCYRNRDRIPLNTESIVGGLILLSRRLGGKMMSNVSDVNGAPITYKTESLERDGIPFPPDLSPRYLPLNQQTRSQCTITLFSKQNSKVLGALVLESSQSDRFSNEDEYTLWGVAKQARFALERQQLVSQIRFQDTVASMTVWASDIAHSLNREIGRIRKRTFWLQNEFALPHQANQYIDEIEHSAVTLVQVQQESQREPSDTNCVIKLVPAVTEWVENFLEERGESTCAIFHHSEEQLYAQADGTIVRRVLQDLMRNAAEAMFQQPEPKLIISTGRADPGMIEIRIEDTGPGISNGPLRARIFQEPFSTRGNNRGRGLVLARYSIEQMGGYIRLLPNEPGRGAIFAIQLPAAEVHEPQFA